MAKIISLVNQKGGVAKTTSTYNIACALVNKGQKVLMVDLDPQASLTIACGYEPYKITKNIYNAMMPKSSNDYCNIKDCIIEKSLGLYLIPSDITLASWEMMSLRMMDHDRILSRILNEVEESYDFILVDCPPQLSTLVFNALLASDSVLIPCKPDYMAYRGLENLIMTVKDIIETKANPKLSICGIIITLYDKRIKDDNMVIELIEENYSNILGIVNNLAVAKKGIYKGISTVNLFPESAVAKEYIAITDKILNKFK